MMAQLTLVKIANAIVICKPACGSIINTGTEADRQFIRDLAVDKGEEKPLAMENHTIHFDLKEEQGRIIDRTYYIADEWEHVSSLANRIDRPTAPPTSASNLGGLMRA
jgi:phosphoenolpyruvate carboxykinase (GTP)